MSVQTDKLMTLGDGQVLYNDLRDRMEETNNALADFNSNIIVESDITPYLFKKTEDIGDMDCLKDKIIGCTIVWNQQVFNGNFVDTSTWQTTDSTKSVANNIMSVLSTTEGGGRIDIFPAMVPNHRYLFTVQGKAAAEGDLLARIYYGNYGAAQFYVSATSTDWQTITKIITTTTTGNIYDIRLYGPSTTIAAQFKNVMLIDLTQMFGATMADMIYAMETTTAGAGIAWFRNLFPNDYYSYNTGELINVKTSGHKITGKNLIPPIQRSSTSSGLLFSENTDGSISITGTANGVAQFVIHDNIPISSKLGTILFSGLLGSNIQWNTSYLIDKDGQSVKSLLSSGTNMVRGGVPGASNVAFDISDSPTAVGLVLSVKRRANTATHDQIHPMISIYSTDTTWEPYQSITYPYAPVELRGFPTLIDGALTYDGDTYEADGTVTRKYGIVDLGSLTWTYDASYTRFYSQNHTEIKQPIDNDSLANIICPLYKCVSFNTLYNGSEDKVICFPGDGYSLSIRNTGYTDATAFKSAMSGVYLVYALAVETIETVESFDAAQRIYPHGTMEYIDTRPIPIPVGHNGIYGHYLRMKTEDIPTRDKIKEQLISPVEQNLIHTQQELTDTQAGMAIVIDGDTASKNITSGQYVYVKNHSTLATGMYHATTAIASGASIGNSNVNQDIDGLTNALNNSIININNKLPSESQSYQITGGLWINGSGARCLYLPVQLNKTPIVTKIELSGGTDITSDFNLGYSGNGQLFVYTWEYTYDGQLINVSYKLSN